MNTRFSSTRSARAFTLVELLAVISIIAVLVGLVVPSFRAARAHTRTITCQTNLSNICKSLISYALDTDSFPITTDASGTRCSWRYGGWSGANQNNLWKSYLQGSLYVPTDMRPLSRYMHDKPLGEEARMPVFQCPSDTRSFRASMPIWMRNVKLTAYEDIGTSYHLNWQWYEAQTKLPGVPASQNRAIDRVPRGERIWWKYMDRNAARFVALIEDPADFGFQNKVLNTGYHQKALAANAKPEMTKHNFAFLDGHAEFITADTRFLLQRGRWTLIDETPPYRDWLPAQ